MYLSSQNHGSGKWPAWRLKSSCRTPIFHWTMIMGERWRKGMLWCHGTHPSAMSKPQKSCDSTLMRTLRTRWGCHHGKIISCYNPSWELSQSLTHLQLVKNPLNHWSPWRINQISWSVFHCWSKVVDYHQPCPTWNPPGTSLAGSHFIQSWAACCENALAWHFWVLDFRVSITNPTNVCLSFFGV